MDRAKAHPLAILVAAGAWLSACGLNQAGVDPPRDTIAFPASAIMDNSGQWLFVTNSNADLRYNDGTLMALSLERAAVDRVPGSNPKACADSAECDAPLSCIDGVCNWENCPRVSYPNPRSDPAHFCCWDALDRNILNCDERAYVGPDDDIGNGNGNVRIGSFAAAMVLQHRQCPTTTDPACAALCDPNAGGNDRLLLGVRGDTSLTFVDVEKFPPPMPDKPDEPQPPPRPPQLTCSGESGEFVVCDEDHRISRTGSALAAPGPEEMPPEVSLPDEPYALALDDANGLLYVGHLTGNTSRPFSGGFSLFDVMPFGDAPLGTPRLISPFSTPFPPNSVGAVGITSLKSFKPSGSVTNIYATSRFVPQVAPLGVTAVCPQAGGTVREIAAFPNGAYYSSPLGGTETRGIEFVGDRTFVLQRSPPALISFLNPYTPTEVLETCGSPTFLSQYFNGLETRLFVTCSSDGEIYVFDPTVPRLVQTFNVGRGPAGLVFDEAREVAYSVNFGDNGVAVIDLDPDSPTEYHVIQRLGFPRTTPR
jgi:hypothetical protein